MFLSGVSTRKVGDVLDALCGSRLSASYVSKVTKELDSAVRDFAHIPIGDDFKLLFLDGLSVKVRMELKVKRYMLLVAYGVRADGSRRLIGFQRVRSESYACWKAFLGNLQTRGLLGKNLELITMDGAPGLWAAIEEIYPIVRHQLCWVHKLRNVSKYCPKSQRKECMNQVAKIMYAPSSATAAKRFRRWKREWQDKIPKAVKCLEDDFHRLIPVFEFPEQIRKMIRTTNVIERCFREVRRRLKVMGYFQNSKSCDKIIFALFSYFNSKWLRNNQRITAIRNLYRKAA
jgi:transposase-like protein